MTEPTLEDLLISYPPEVRRLVTKARALILEVIPGAIEMVDLSSKMVAYGYGLKYADLICGIMPYKSYVNLIFANGARLPDPDGLLKGTGKHARHVRFQSSGEVKAPGVRSLLEEAKRAKER